MKPSDIYQQQIKENKILPNSNQLKVLGVLDDIYQKLIEKKPSTKFKKIFSKKKEIKGIYMWGSVGVGKTFLMDLFYHSLPPSIKKMRMHFHEFMQMVHFQLKKIQGTENPLKHIAKKLSENSVLCLDEFLVQNIADAMILAGLLKALFEEGITLITSSNVAPDDLYKEGIQREQFFPAINLIKTHTHIIYLYSSQDYRLRHLQQAGIYYTPLNQAAQSNMNKIFEHFTENYSISYEPITLFGREIPIVKEAHHIIWFEFKKICGIPRSQKDYLALAKKYRILLISDIHVIGSEEDSLITSFINLIDVLYDARVRIVMSAEKPIQEIYPKGNLLFEFQRTQSRIMEMQSEEYFYLGIRPNTLTTL